MGEDHGGFKSTKVQKDGCDLLTVSARDQLRRIRTLPVSVISAWREGKRRLQGHRASFLVFRELGNGLERDPRPSGGLSRTFRTLWDQNLWAGGTGIIRGKVWAGVVSGELGML